MKKRKVKKSFNARLSEWERRLQDIPTWSVVVLITVAFSGGGTPLLGLKGYEKACKDQPPPFKIVNCVTLHFIESVFKNIEKIAILSATAVYLKESPDRKDKKHYEAWQVVEKAKGREISYSRNKALEDLNNGHVSLEGLDAPKANLSRINLPGAKLKGANLSESDFSVAELPRANLIKANLEAANLEGVGLQDAWLNMAHLPKAKLQRAKLQGATLEGANLEGANLEGANLEGANLEGANLEAIISSETTVWPDISELRNAQNIPPELQVKLRMLPSQILPKEET